MCGRLSWTTYSLVARAFWDGMGWYGKETETGETEGVRVFTLSFFS